MKARKKQKSPQFKARSGYAYVWPEFFKFRDTGLPTLWGTGTQGQIRVRWTITAAPKRKGRKK